MIDFRYHLVSIIAVFLALAVGLLVGSAYLSGPVETGLKAAEQLVTDANKSLTAKNDALNHQVSAEEAFAQASSERLLAGLLTSQKVVLVEAPGVSDQMTSGIIAALHQAGATVTEEVALQSNFLATGGAAESSLTQLARQWQPDTGVALPASPLYPGTAGQQQAAAVIAASIVSKDGVGLTAGTSQAILAGFAQQGFLQVKNTAGMSSATLAVLLTPAGTQPQPISQGLAAFAAELKSASLGAVMAGALSPVTASNAVTVEAGSGMVSTVDNANTESGQIIVSQVLRGLLNGKPAAAYGVGPGTAPSPAPTPSATQTSTQVTPSNTRSPSTGTSKGTGK